jgi:hypothetical protein
VIERAYVRLAPPLPVGRVLRRRTERCTPPVAASALEELVLAVGGRLALAASAWSRAREAVGKAAAIYGESFGAKGPVHTRRQLARTHQDPELAGLVVVNVRVRDDRAVTERMLDEITQILSDDALRTAVSHADSRTARRSPRWWPTCPIRRTPAQGRRSRASGQHSPSETDHDDGTLR